ncbi:MAG: hypothetical protein ACLTXI_01310 [Collinsella sp.]
MSRTSSQAHVHVKLYHLPLIPGKESHLIRSLPARQRRHAAQALARSQSPDDGLATPAHGRTHAADAAADGIVLGDEVGL